MSPTERAARVADAVVSGISVAAPRAFSAPGEGGRAVAQAVAAAGGQAHPADITAAGDLVEQHGLPARDALERAAIEQALHEGKLTPDELAAVYGHEDAFDFRPAEPTESAPPDITTGPGSHAVAQAIADAGGQAHPADIAAAGRLVEQHGLPAPDALERAAMEQSLREGKLTSEQVAAIYGREAPPQSSTPPASASPHGPVSPEGRPRPPPEPQPTGTAVPERSGAPIGRRF
jgi:hypothetical protein